MAKVVLAGLVLIVGLVSPTTGVPAQPGTEIVARDVEAAFRGAMEMWAYREFWHLWEESSRESRFYITQQEFAAQMEKGIARLAPGREVEDLKISFTSLESALVVARIGLEDPGINRTRSVVRSFLFYHQDGRWRPQLSDFLGLASYAFPLQPAIGPVLLIAPCCQIRMLPSSPRILIVPCCQIRVFPTIPTK